MLKLKFQKLHEEFFIVLRRFPLAILSSLLLTIYVMNPSSWPESWHKQALISIFVINILWFVSVKLIAESQRWRKAYSTTLAIMIFGFIAFYLYTHYSPLPSSLLMALGFVSLISVAPYISKFLNTENMWSYHYQLGMHFLFALLVSLVICSGMGLILMSLDYLFHLIVLDDQYEKLIKVTVCFLLPVIFMMGIPSRFNEPEEETHTKNIQLLLNYAMTPILLVFSLILIVYAFKIFIIQNLPRGKVALLVACFGTLGSFAFLLGDTRKMSLSTAHTIFRKHFFHLLIIPLILMAIGIGVRIHQYGLTTERYFVCLVFISLLLFTIYSFVGSRIRITRFMLLCVSSLSLFGAFGPWGIVELSSLSQFKRLQHLLEKNHILENNKIQKNHPPLDSKDEVEINNIINYIAQYGNPRDLKSWFDPEVQKLLDIPNQSKLHAKDLAMLIGIKYELKPRKNVPKDIFSFKHRVNNSVWVKLKGGGYLLKNLSIEPQILSDIERSLPNRPNFIVKISFDKRTQKMTFQGKKDSHEGLVIDIKEIVAKLKDKKERSIIDDALVYEGTTDSLYLRFSIQNIDGNFDKKGEPLVSIITGDLFIRPLS